MKSTFKGPVFLVGCPRSGTTLLQRMLDAHSRIAMAPETHFIRRFWRRRAHHRDIASDENFRSLVDAIVSMPEFGEMGLDADAFREAAWAGAREHRALFQLVLAQFGALNNASVVGEKTPNHLLYMRILERFFPDARFIHIVRDPRAVVNSWKGVPWSTGTVAGDAMVWRRYMRTSRRHPPRAESSLLTVHYEQLISQPQKTMEAICRFIGIEYDPAMYSFSERETGTVNVSREPWKIGVTRPIDPARLKGWQTELSEREVARIEAAAGCEMKRLGYKPRTGPARRLAIGACVWPVEAIRLTGRVLRRLAR